MDPQYSVLLFSKYSQNCNKLFSIMTNSGVNFSPLQSLCIDNENIRKRILENKQFNITVVPSILCVFSNGNVETYEGLNAFNWVQSIIAKFAPPPQPPQQLPPQPPQQLPPPPPVQHLPPPPPRRIPRRVVEQEEEDYEVDVNKMRTRSSGNDPKGLGDDPDDLPVLSQKEISALQRSIEDRGESKTTRTGETKVKTRPKMEPRDEPVRRRVSPLSQIPFSSETEDDEDNSLEADPDDDRHKTIRKPPRIRHDEGNYEEDDTLFNDEIVENRKEPKNTVKQKAQKSTKEVNNIKSKADALALDREMSEKEINKPVTRSDSEFRRP